MEFDFTKKLTKQRKFEFAELRKLTCQLTSIKDTMKMSIRRK